MQLECPLDVVREAAKLANEKGVRVVLNPSPWSDDFIHAGIPCDVLIVNETEAEALLAGRAADVSLFDADVPFAKALDHLVITHGAGATRVLSKSEGVLEAAPPRVDPVDTVGAGDSFAGALTVALSEGRPLREAVAFANAAGALATLEKGAQAAVPQRKSILEAML